MGWVRPDDALKRINTVGAQTNFTSIVRPKNRLGIRADNDAAIKFMHDFKDLLNKYLVRGHDSPIEGGFEVENMGVIDNVLSVFALDFGDKDCRINFQITPNFLVEGAEGNEPYLFQALLGSLVDGAEDRVINPQHERNDRGQVQETHGDSPCCRGVTNGTEPTAESPSVSGNDHGGLNPCSCDEEVLDERSV